MQEEDYFQVGKLKEECTCCKLNKFWNGFPIELVKVEDIWYCPNCYSQIEFKRKLTKKE